MKAANLFQTLTRPNRPWKNPITGQRKEYGRVVDYIGWRRRSVLRYSAHDPQTTVTARAKSTWSTSASWSASSPPS